MLVSHDAYYLDIGKTASTYVFKQMELTANPDKKNYGGRATWPHKFKNHGQPNFSISKGQNVIGAIHSDRHGRLRDYTEEAYADKLIFASTRHPLKYYHSIWKKEGPPKFHEDGSMLHPGGPTKRGLYSNDPDFECTMTNFILGLQDPSVSMGEQSDGKDPFSKPNPNIIHEMPDRSLNRPAGLGVLTFRYLDWLDGRFFTVKRTWGEVEQWYADHYFNPSCPIVFIGPRNVGQDFHRLVKSNIDKFYLKPDWEKEFGERIKANTYLNESERLDQSQGTYRKAPEAARAIMEGERILFNNLDFPSVEEIYPDLDIDI